MCGTEHPTCLCDRGGFLVVEQAVAQARTRDERRVGVFGPASVDVRSEDGKVVTMAAIQRALPQLYRRERLSVLHKDQLVGQIHESLKLDAARVPQQARGLVQALGGEVRTGLYTVTDEIVAAFPKLAAFKGTEQLFVAATVWGDNETSRIAQAEVLEGKLDSFSISGWATRTEQGKVCDVLKGCRETVEIQEMDLSAVTLASTTAKDGHFTAVARNPVASLLVVQQAHSHVHAAASPPSHPVGEHMNPQEQEKPKVEQGQGGTQGGGDVLAGVQQALADLSRRVETVEQGVGEVRSALAKTPTTQAGNGYNGEKKVEEKKEDKKEEQAKVPAPLTADALAQAVAAGVKAGLEQAGVKPAGKVEQAAPAPPANPVVTPVPGAGPSGAQAGASRANALLEAADSGNPARLKEAMRALRAGKAPGGA